MPSSYAASGSDREADWRRLCGNDVPGPGRLDDSPVTLIRGRPPGSWLRAAGSSVRSLFIAVSRIRISPEPRNRARSINVQRHMRWSALLVAMAVGLSACGGPSPASPEASIAPSTTASTSTTTSTPSGVGSGDVADGSSADLMAAAVLQLITEDHTFGEGPSPFTEYLIQTHLDPFAGAPTGPDRPTRALTELEQATIEAAVRPLGNVRWIDDPDLWRTDDLQPTVEGGAILGVGEPSIDGSARLVPVSLWCGGLCGTWLTYRLEAVDGNWVVTGVEGPIAIS